jgi:hypothetical protein
MKTRAYGYGDRVRCIDADFESWVREYVDEVPVEGGIYTIREICFEASDCHAGNYAPGFFFEEIPDGLPECKGRLCWEARRFEPTGRRKHVRSEKAVASSSRTTPLVA